MDGDSKIKKILGKYSMDHIRYAIDKEICLANLGSTYLEQTVSNVLRDMVQANIIPLSKLNDARNYFYLDEMTPEQLQKQTKPTP